VNILKEKETKVITTGQKKVGVAVYPGPLIDEKTVAFIMESQYAECAVNPHLHTFFTSQ
jgi:hypothetical protein